MKAFGQLARMKQPVFSKSFLFRVASNKWIDECRRNRHKLVSYEENDELIGAEMEEDPLETEDRIRELLHLLSPKQTVILLLIDVFAFNGRETAAMLNMTESAVFTALHRSRNKLRKVSAQVDGSLKNVMIREKKSEVVKAVVTQFVEAFRNRNFKSLAELIDDHAVANIIVHSSAEYGKDVIIESSLAEWERIHTKLGVHTIDLWDRQAIVFLSEGEGAPLLWDINTIQVETGKITRWDSYYFSKELLQHAADMLGLLVDTTKKSYGKPWMIEAGGSYEEG